MEGDVGGLHAGHQGNRAEPCRELVLVGSLEDQSGATFAVGSDRDAGQAAESLEGGRAIALGKEHRQTGDMTERTHAAASPRGSWSVKASAGQAVVQAEQPVQAASSSAGTGGPPSRGRKRIADASQASAQL